MSCLDIDLHEIETMKWNNKNWLFLYFIWKITSYCYPAPHEDNVFPYVGISRKLEHYNSNEKKNWNKIYSQIDFLWT
jgi:hypothetical protein